jgi:hypothetical protein
MDQKEPKKAIKSSVLNCGKKTYFFDVREASNNKRYLKITESRLVEQGQPAKRTSVVLFPEEVQNFQSRMSEITGFLSEQATVAA